MTTQKNGTLAAGDIDQSFGDGGTVNLKFPTASFGSVWDLALTSDRKILAIGGTYDSEFIVARLTESGELDSSFGSAGSGSVKGHFSKGNPSLGQSVGVLGDGKILVGGTYIKNDQVLPAANRFFSNGELDETFGQDGYFVLPPLTPSAKKVANSDPISERRASSSTSSLRSSVLPDGKILIFHTMFGFGYGVLIRLTAEGVLDTSFNDTGYTIVRYPQAIVTHLYSAITTSKGEIVVGGQIVLPGKPPTGMLARYGVDGRPDKRFGSDGTGFIEINAGERALRVDDLVPGEADKFVGVGVVAELDGRKQAAMIFGRTANGLPDPSFNNGELTEFVDRIRNGRTEWYSAAATSTTDNIVVTGISFSISGNGNKNEGVLVARYLRTGTLDKAFGGGNGWVQLEPGFEPRLILQADGKMLVCYGLEMPPPLASDPVITRLLN